MICAPQLRLSNLIETVGQVDLSAVRCLVLDEGDKLLEVLRLYRFPVSSAVYIVFLCPALDRLYCFPVSSAGHRNTM
eukprot:SAG31_NODE_1745_length_7379_cov_8.772115_3_plen_77_part_00